MSRDLANEIAALRRIGARVRVGRGRFPADPIRRGIANPRAFVCDALNDELRARGAHLDPSRYELCVSYLLEVLARVASRYDPRRGSLSFSTFAYRILRRRYTSWLREDRGDSRYGNDGREESVADPDEYRTSVEFEDSIDFDALIDQIDHAKLSPRARGALTAIARRMAEEGISAAAAAADLAKTRREAEKDLDRLRRELAA